jgi:hypothetical protein
VIYQNKNDGIIFCRKGSENHPGFFIQHPKKGTAGGSDAEADFTGKKRTPLHVQNQRRTEMQVVESTGF